LNRLLHVRIRDAWRSPIFPGFVSPLVITDEGLIEALTALKKTPAPFVGVFLLRDPKINLQADKFSDIDGPDLRHWNHGAYTAA